MLGCHIFFITSLIRYAKRVSGRPNINIVARFVSNFQLLLKQKLVSASVRTHDPVVPVRKTDLATPGLCGRVYHVQTPLGLISFSFFIVLLFFFVFVFWCGWGCLCLYNNRDKLVNGRHLNFFPFDLSSVPWRFVS